MQSKVRRDRFSSHHRDVSVHPSIQTWNFLVSFPEAGWIGSGRIRPAASGSGAEFPQQLLLWAGAEGLEGPPSPGSAVLGAAEQFTAHIQ